jgi:hypothetical protein
MPERIFFRQTWLVCKHECNVIGRDRDKSQRSGPRPPHLQTAEQNVDVVGDG